MSFLGHPQYHLIRFLNQQAMENLPLRDYFRNYIVVEARFSHPDEVKFPGIPQNVDDTTTIYPKSGNGVMTGYEFLLAKNLGCELKNVHAMVIPFKTESEIATPYKKAAAGGGGASDILTENFVNSLKTEDIKSVNDYKEYAPFMEIVNRVQAERRKHSKKTFENAFYKLLGNAGYGLISQGLGGKRKFDIKTNDMTIMNAGLFSNPVLASSVTGLIRSVITESMNNINYLGGRVISVTTDGFITDLENLEEKLLTLDLEKTVLLRYYRLIRKVLSGNSSAFELKHTESKGLIT